MLLYVQNDLIPNCCSEYSRFQAGHHNQPARDREGESEGGRFQEESGKYNQSPRSSVPGITGVSSYLTALIFRLKKNYEFSNMPLTIVLNISAVA